MRGAAESGRIREAVGRVDAWVAERLARHRKPGEPIIQQRTDGRWVQITERETHDGGIVAIYADITDLKRTRSSWRQRGECARSSATSGVVLAVRAPSRLTTRLQPARDLRGRVANRAFRNLWKLPESFLSQRPTLAELIELNHKNGCTRASSASISRCAAPTRACGTGT